MVVASISPNVFAESQYVTSQKQRKATVPVLEKGSYLDFETLQSLSKKKNKNNRVRLVSSRRENSLLEIRSTNNSTWQM